ncbi:MAG: acyl-CoA/acyl-ACP dehydrogenase [Desulfurococcales archaeon]|nr:acyl-CoA/acyl-ACP dehydrogenase [Desulfurococcales archaeon]
MPLYPPLGDVPEGLRALLVEELPRVAGDIDRLNAVPDGFLARLESEGAFTLSSVGGLLEAVRLASRSSPAVGHVILIHGMAWRLLEGRVGGRGVAAVSITEPGGGSDVLGNLETRAEPGDGGWRVSGVKVFTSNALYARYFLVLAAAPEGPTLYAVERGGRVRVEAMDLTTLRGAGVGRVEYLSAPAVRVGEPGRGLREALEGINLGRLGYAAIALGIAEGALSAALERMRTHRVFGRPLGEYQGVRWMVAETAAEASALAALVAHAARAAEGAGGRVDPLAAAEAKVLGARVAQRASWLATQLMGGRGLARWSLTERLSRDSRVLDIGEGAREVLLDFIGSRLLKSGL